MDPFFRLIAGDAQPVRRSRAWTEDGRHCTQNDVSYKRSNGSKLSYTRKVTIEEADADSPRASHNVKGAMRGTLRSIFKPSTQRQSSSYSESTRRMRADEENNHRSDALNERRNRVRHRSPCTRSAISRSDMHSSQRARRDRRGDYRDQTPFGPSPPLHKGARSSHRSAYVEDFLSSDEDDEDDTPNTQSYERLDDLHHDIEALENAAEFHRRKARSARRRLERDLEHSYRDQRHLQYLADQVEDHEDSRDRALRDLKEAQRSADKMQRERQNSQRHHQRHWQQRASDSLDDFEDDPMFSNLFSNDPFFNGSPDIIQGSTHAQDIFGEEDFFSHTLSSAPRFEAFDYIFAGFEHLYHDHERLFSMPGLSFSFGIQPRAAGTSRASYRSPRFQQHSTYTPQVKTPPATLLKPEEAQRLFASYDVRWNTTALDDPNVPFPARGLKAKALCRRETLWAPTISSPTETWSEETVLKANVHLFFLGAVGLQPAYTETSGGKIELGIDKSSASTAQIQRLIEILKKERFRWHSDRLGKRNQGRPGPNEALQSDERARAVYHGVCELIQAAQ